MKSQCTLMMISVRLSSACLSVLEPRYCAGLRAQFQRRKEEKDSLAAVFGNKVPVSLPSFLSDVFVV